MDNKKIASELVKIAKEIVADRTMNLKTVYTMVTKLDKLTDDFGHAVYCDAGKPDIIGESLSGSCTCGYREAVELIDKIKKELEKPVKIAAFPDQIFPDENPDIDKEHAEAVAKLNTELVRTDKREAWYSPHRSIVLNMPLTGGLDIMQFSCLPMFPLRRAIQDNGAEGKVLMIQPAWHFPSHDGYRSYDVPKIVDKLISLVKGSETIEQVVKKELAALESQLKITISPLVKEEVVRYSMKVAVGRITTRSLNIKPKEFPI